MGSKRPGVMRELAESDSCLGGVVGNVPAQVVKLFFAAEKMIERVLLPKSTFLMQSPVDLRRRVVLPRFTLGHHRSLVRKGRQQVDVVGHHHEIK